MGDSQGLSLPECLQEDYQGFIIFVHQAGGLVRGKKTLCQWLEDSLKLLKIKATTLSVDTLMKETNVNATIRSKSKKKNPKIIIRALRSNSVTKNQPLLASLLNSSTSNQANNNKAGQGVAGSVSVAARPQASVTSRITYSKSRQIKPLNNKTSSQIHSQNWSKMGAGAGSVGQIVTPIDCVHLGVFKSHLRQMGILEEICWVLIVESHYKLVMDMDELEELSREFSFKTFWISAYSRQNTEQCIFEIVNEIFVYKNELLRKKLEYLRALNPADIMLINSNISSAISTNVNTKQPPPLSSRKFSRSRSRSKSSTVKKFKADSQIQLEASEYASKARLKFGKNVSVPKWTSLIQCTTGNGTCTGPHSNYSKSQRTMVENEQTSDSETDAEFHQESTIGKNELLNCIEKLKLIDGVGNGGSGGGLDSKMILQEMDENLKKRVALLIVQDLLRDQDEMNEN